MKFRKGKKAVKKSEYYIDEELSLLKLGNGNCFLLDYYDLKYKNEKYII